MGPAALLIAGGGTQAFAAIQEGRIAEKQGKFTKKIAIRNQQALERQRTAEREASAVEERRISRREKIVKGAQRATIAKSGVGLAGATLSLLADTAFQFSMDRNLTLRRGLIRGRELRERGKIQLAQGSFARSLGLKAKQLSFIQAGGSILSSVGSAQLASTGSTAPTQSQLTTSRFTGFRSSQNFGPGAFGR